MPDDKPLHGNLVPAVGPLDGEPVPCALESLDEVSARIRLTPETRLPEMASVALWLQDKERGSAVVVPAYSGWPEEDGDGLVCELYFAQPNALHGYQGDAMDRRSAVRVVPAPDEVEVWLHTERPGQDDPVECVLVDLGEGGMCVEMTVGLEPSAPFSLAVFQVLLPGATWPLVLQAQVRHRARVSREIVRYGLEFDATRTVDFDEQRSHIAGFVSGRVAAVANVVELRRSGTAQAS